MGNSLGARAIKLGERDENEQGQGKVKRETGRR